MKNLLLTYILLVSVLSLSAQEPKNCEDPDCKVDSLIINTGYDHFQQSSYGIGQPDAYWEVVNAPNSGLNLPTPAWTINKNSAWINPSADAEWISAYSFQNWSQNNQPPDQPYTFQFCFCVCEGVDSIEIDMQLFADNQAKVMLNGDSLYTFPNPNTVLNFQQGAHINEIREVKPGEYCLSVELRNWSAIAMGLLIEGSIKGITPEGSDPAPVFLSQVCCDPSGTILGRKINDINCNGRDDNTPNNPNIEPGLAGWEIVLNPGNITTTTDANGFYYFNNLPPGNYTVTETQQSGWTQSMPSQGSYNITLNPNQILELNFANCETELPPCEDMGEGILEDDCCRYLFGLNNSIGNITQINYYVTGGTIDDISASPCSYTTIPANLSGSTSGSLIYSTPCDSVQQFEVDATSNTASGWISIEWVVYHGDVDSCVYNTRFRCERASLDRCDSLAILPLPYDLDKKYNMRRFRIYNNKIPVSPICEYRFDLIPATGYSFNNLQADYGLVNYSLPYSQNVISPAANDWIQFDLLVSLINNSWNGDLEITIYHCDGDSCKFTYDKWNRLEPLPWEDDVISIAIPSPRMAYIPLELNWKAIERLAPEAVSASVEFTKGVNRLVSVSVAINDSNRLYRNKILSSSIEENNAVVYIFDPAQADSLVEVSYIDHLCELAEDDINEVEYQLVLYDVNSKPILRARDTVETGSLVSVEDKDTPISSIMIRRLIPNPTDNNTTIELFSEKLTNIEISIHDIFGQTLISYGNRDINAGNNFIDLDLSELSSGTYIIRISSEKGVISERIQLVK